MIAKLIRLKERVKRFAFQGYPFEIALTETRIIFNHHGQWLSTYFN